MMAVDEDVDLVGLLWWSLESGVRDYLAPEGDHHWLLFAGFGPLAETFFSALLMLSLGRDINCCWTLGTRWWWLLVRWML